MKSRKTACSSIRDTDIQLALPSFAQIASNIIVACFNCRLNSYDSMKLQYSRIEIKPRRTVVATRSTNRVEYKIPVYPAADISCLVYSTANPTAASSSE